MPKSPPATTASAATPSIVGRSERPEERQDRERQEPEHEVAREEGIRLLPDQEEAVDPQPAGAEVVGAGEDRQRRGQQRDPRPARHRRASRNVPMGRTGSQRSVSSWSERTRVEAGDGHRRREQDVEARRVVGRAARVRAARRQLAAQDRVGQRQVVEQVAAEPRRAAATRKPWTTKTAPRRPMSPSARPGSGAASRARALRYHPVAMRRARRARSDAPSRFPPEVRPTAREPARDGARGAPGDGRADPPLPRARA